MLIILNSITNSPLFMLLIIAAIFVAWRMTHYNDSAYVKEQIRIKGRTDDQKAVLRYFCNEPGFLWKKPISDEEYDKMVFKVLEANDYRQKALNKIGLDESQVNEIEPVHFEGFQFDNGKDSLSKKGKDRKWRSTKYQVSWLFFSATQVYLYQNTFNMDEDGKKESTEEYFYKDITNFSTSSETVESYEYDKVQKKTILINVDTNRFTLTVPGDKFYCFMEQNDYTEAAIQGMKAMLRDKKNS